MTDQSILKVNRLSKVYQQGWHLPWLGLPAPRVVALEEVSFSLQAGNILGVVGESGSGKSTLGEIVAGLIWQSRGDLSCLGQDPRTLRGESLRSWRRRVQIIFQNPFSALNPRMTIQRNLVEPLRIHKTARRQEERQVTANALIEAGLPRYDEILDRFPNQLSGGQLQRVTLARSLLLRPCLLVADEPVSMLDISVRAAFLSQLQKARENYELAILYISHNLAEVAVLADRVLVLYRGRMVEFGPASSVLHAPMHPYTRELLAAVPRLNQSKSGKQHDDRQRQEDDLAPWMKTKRRGCLYRWDCQEAKQECESMVPELRPVGRDHFAACLHFGAGSQPLCSLEHL